MIKENKLKIIISSIVTLLPCVFGLIVWNKLPEISPIHWGADGNADGMGSKAFIVFGMPAILLVFHLLCIVLTAFDKNQKGQNKKALGIIFWIIPFVSLFISAVTYSVAFGKQLSVNMLVPVLFGAMFVYMGNYMPKVKQNRTLGIKIPWTLSNEENWNLTHRLCGKIWFLGGLVIIFTAFLPIKVMVAVLVSVMILLIVVPFVYSYSLFRKHKKEGIEYTFVSGGKSEKIAVRITAVVVPIILIGSMVLMFTGNIKVDFNKTSFTINATYYSDLTVDYSEIDSLEYREDFDAGMRTYGFGSPRLSMGVFENDEFGTYTRYTYTGNKEAIILKVDDNILAISGKNDDETREIYKKIFEKV